MSARILIIDDSLTVRMSLSGLLNGNGFETLAVADLEAARAVLRQEQFALSILDVELPDGDGIAFLRELRSDPRLGNLPVMLLSTRAEVEDRVRGLERGADEYVGKPYDQSLVIRRARELTSRAPESTGIRLLVIEDSLTYAAYITDLLRKQGYDVLTAITGEEGLAVAGKERPNAILVDSRLPGIAGPDVIRQIRQDAALRRTPTLVLTASPDPDDEIRALKAGADSFLRKGQDPNVILACINVMLRSRGLALGPSSPRTLTSNRVACITGGNRVSQRLANAPENLAEFEFFATLEEFLQRPDELAPDCIVLETGDDLERAQNDSRELRSRPQLTDTSILVLGSVPYSEAVLPCVNAGADDYIPSNMEIQIVAARIAAQLRRKQYEDENRSIREQLLRSDMIARSQQELALSSAAKNEELRQLAVVAQQKAREAEEARREVQQLAESIPQIVWAADESGNATYFNLRWYEYTGFSEAESTGEGWWNAVDAAHRESGRKLWRQAVESGRNYSAEHQIRGKDGQYRWFLARAVPMRGGQGRVLRWFGTCTDIEERKNTEEALRRSEKLAATGRLAAAIAHEINNPLEAVVNLLYLARTVVLSSPTDAGKYLVMAEKELARVAHISKKTLAFYRDSTDPHETDVCSLVGEVAEVYSAHATSARVEIKGEYACTLRPKILAGEIRQVISNVIANAIDASRAEGRLRVRVHDSFNYRTRQRGVRIVVADNGSGISESVRSRLFQPFVTTKKDRGTGLGLWVSASIIERHNGSIRVRSVTESGRSGTCMSIFLPEHSDIRTDADETAELLKAVGRDLLGAQPATRSSAGD